MSSKLFALSLFLACAPFAHAEKKSQPIAVEGGYVFQPMKGTNATAAYGTIKNETDREISVAVSSAEGFKAAELHETTSTGGMMKMHKLDQVKIAKKGSFELKPGGNHVMLFDATKEFKLGQSVAITFSVDGKKVPLSFPVKPRGASSEGPMKMPMHH